MIFIDVTQSCRSSNNSGIQVVTRNLFREIDSKKEVTPLAWDNFIKRYTRLDNREIKNLNNPFHKNYQPRERPNKQENPVHKELLKSILRLKRIQNFKKEVTAKNLFIFPEVFRDNRVIELPKLKTHNIIK
jgi:hypothetical protein